MGSTLLPLYEDPWTSADLFHAFIQLLFTFLFLVNAIIMCIIYLLRKWYGWGHPSSYHNLHQACPSVLQSAVSSKPFAVDPNESGVDTSMRAGKLLKRVWSQGRKVNTNTSHFCPKCDDTCTKERDLFLRHEKYYSYRCRKKHSFSCPTQSPGVGVTSSSTCASRIPNAEVMHFNEEICQMTGRMQNNFNSPSTCSQMLGENETLGINSHPDKLQAEGSSSKQPRLDILPKASPRRVCSEIGIESFLSNSSVQKEILDEIEDGDVDVFHLFRKKCGNRVASNLSVKQSDFKDCDMGWYIESLKDTILGGQKKLRALYAELEVERLSSATAANEAMSMIARLQEEKAALCMEASHYQRIAEERAIHEEQAMQLLKDILVKKESEIFLLEKEVKILRAKHCSDFGEQANLRQGVEEYFSDKGHGLLLLEYEGDVGRVNEISTGNKVRKGKESTPSDLTEEQPLKRLRGIIDHEDVVPERSCEGQKSVGLVVCSDQMKALLQEIEKVPEEDLPFQQKVSASGNINVTSDGSSVPMHDILSSVESSKNDNQVIIAQARENEAINKFIAVDKSAESLKSEREFAIQDDAGAFINKITNVDKSAEFSMSEGVFALQDNAESVLVNTLIFSSFDINATVDYGEETQNSVTADSLKLSNTVSGRKSMMDLQAYEVDKLACGCPYLLSHKSSNFKSFEEIDNTLLRSPVH
ncbi:hypothetical protein KP509_02G079500 [Ceratopteris richardii]|uniref:GTD-binding domain-containing protein n=1 Tax=Ceratopteris richardii TaxID=49495 RepID=A0A8T2VAR8_CERRI|nr:hypothetical protein KP509_02G079500 [Ceratopteris richardii]